MKKVGIVPCAKLFSTDNLYDDRYVFINSYVTRAAEAGLLPIGVLPVDGFLVEGAVEECDCFILVGGSGIYPHYMQVIDHAVKNGKKLLGICLGCQSIHSYFKLREKMEAEGITEEIGAFWAKEKAAGTRFLKDIEGHRTASPIRDRLEDIKHPVLVKEGTLLHKLTGKTELMGASLHYCACFDPAPGVTVSGTAPDGTIEALEYGDKILGTQFHPDVDRDLSCLFDFLAQ